MGYNAGPAPVEAFSATLGDGKGNLFIYPDGKDNRWVYIRMSDRSVKIALNEKVEAVYDLPVFVEWNVMHWISVPRDFRVIGLDRSRAMPPLPLPPKQTTGGGKCEYCGTWGTGHTCGKCGAPLPQ
jgi:hypothetical protein